MARVRAAPRRWFSAAKCTLCLNGRAEVSVADIQSVVLPALRHRVILNFEGEAERVDPDMILSAIIKDTPA